MKLSEGLPSIKEEIIENNNSSISHDLTNEEISEYELDLRSLIIYYKNLLDDLLILFEPISFKIKIKYIFLSCTTQFPTNIKQN